MAATRREFDKEFKLQTVKMITEQGRSIYSVGKELGIKDTVIRRWVQQHQSDGSEAFPGRGRLKPTEDEFRRLQREKAQLEEEVRILKKAVAIFSKGPR